MDKKTKKVYLNAVWEVIESNDDDDTKVDKIMKMISKLAYNYNLMEQNVETMEKFNKTVKEYDPCLRVACCPCRCCCISSKWAVIIMSLLLVLSSFVYIVIGVKNRLYGS